MTSSSGFNNDFVLIFNQNECDCENIGFYMHGEAIVIRMRSTWNGGRKNLTIKWINEEWKFGLLLPEQIQPKIIHRVVNAPIQQYLHTKQTPLIATSFCLYFSPCTNTHIHNSVSLSPSLFRCPAQRSLFLSKTIIIKYRMAIMQENFDISTRNEK